MSDFTLFLASSSIVGRREQNQDNLLCLNLNAHKKGNVQAILGVADGMGGEAGGEIASQIAIDRLSLFLKKKPFLSQERWQKELQKFYHRVNKEIFSWGKKTPGLDGMGSTLVCAMIIGDHLVAANVGDSRLYRIRGKTIHQITKDHNLLAKMMSKKKYSTKYLKKKEAFYSSSLLRSLGEESSPKVDCFPKQGKGYPLKDGDIYVLCSDGLTGNCFYPYVRPKDMLKIFSSSLNLKDSCEDLSKMAYENGSDDNVTIVALKVVEQKKIITGSLRLSKKDEPK